MRCCAARRRVSSISRSLSRSSVSCGRAWPASTAPRSMARSSCSACTTRLVEDLLSLSRIELNEHVMPQGSVALGPLLHHLADTLELRAGARGMHIRLDMPPDLPDVIGDRDELAQLFQNLLDNAIKYGRAGSEISVAATSGAWPPFGGDAGDAAFVS